MVADSAGLHDVLWNLDFILRVIERICTFRISLSLQYGEKIRAEYGRGQFVGYCRDQVRLDDLSLGQCSNKEDGEERVSKYLKDTTDKFS